MGRIGQRENRRAGGARCDSDSLKRHQQAELEHRNWQVDGRIVES